MARLVFALAVVLGVMYVAARLLKGRVPGMAARRSPVRIEVLGRQGLGRNASVAVVRAGGKALVVGVTETQVTVLAEADEAALETSDGSCSPSTLFDLSCSRSTNFDVEAEGTRPSWGKPTPRPSWSGVLDAMRERTVRKA